MKKHLNPLQSLIDELHQNKKLHSQLAKNAENDHQSAENGYADFEKGVAYGFELAIEIIAKFQLWQNADVNPPKFDKRRRNPDCPSLMCVVEDYEGGCYIAHRYYDFEVGEWEVFGGFVRFWQEYPATPKELLK